MAESDDESSSEEEESDEEEDSDADLLDEEATDMSGIDSTISHVSGLTTPGMMQIRKGGDRGMETPTGAPRALYQVMEQKKVELGNGFFGTDYSYVLPTEQEQQQQQATDILAGKASSSSSRRSAKDQVAVALNPEELAGLDAVTLKRKYESQLALQKNLQNAESAQRRADIDEVFEENRKKRKLEKGGGKFKNVF